MPGTKPNEPARSNDRWLAALRGGAESSDAVRELERFLGGMITRVVRGRLDADARADLVQESLVRVIESLDSFRGDSAFTTWATAIATRVAFTEMRRRHARTHRPGDFEAIQREVEAMACPTTPAPDARLSRTHLLEVLEHLVATRLTERQRVAIVAELRGLPTIEIADQMGTNQNALYKLVHDARKKLRTALLERGFTANAIHEIVTEARP